MNDNASFLVLFLAPVKDFLADDKVSEILINGPNQIYIERGGRLEETTVHFTGEAQLKAAAVNIAKSVDRQLDEMHPDLDARLPDGSRKIVAVSEVLPLQNGEYRVQTLMQWKTHAMEADGRISGNFEKTSAIPSFKDEAEISALPLE